MSRPSTKGRPHCSSSSAGSTSYQGVSGATSPIYHLPQESYHNTELGNNCRKKKDTEITIKNHHHNYYNIHPKPCCTKDSIADTHSYQYLTEREERGAYGWNVDNGFSDDSSYFDYHQNVDKRYANHVYSEYESDFPIAHKKTFQKQDYKYQSNRGSYHNHRLKENPLIKNHDRLDTVYPEAPLTRPIPDDFRPETLTRRCEPSRLSSDRANSIDSSAVGSAIIDGCGGHCVAFENVCSFVLQIFFVMGILTGVSLCIAGIMLRRSKSRDLQVLMYIGAMSAMVCTLLLVVQCRVRRALQKRKRAIRITRAATIPLGDIRPALHPLIHTTANEDRGVIVPINLQSRQVEMVTEEQGVPWWRRVESSRNRV